MSGRQPPTYELSAVTGVRAIRCLLCGRISELPADVENKYCSRCHLFHDMVADCRAAVAGGGTHECSEWRTYRGVCALCGQRVAQRAIDRLTPYEGAIAATMAVELTGKTQPLHVVYNPLTVFQLTGLIQLALRHQGVTSEIRATGDRFLDGVRKYFADCPTVLDVIRRGDDPAEDR